MNFGAECLWLIFFCSDVLLASVDGIFRDRVSCFVVYFSATHRQLS